MTPEARAPVASTRPRLMRRDRGLAGLASAIREPGRDGAYSLRNARMGSVAAARRTGR